MADNKPTHRLILVSERPAAYGKTKTEFTEICGLWTNDKGSISGTIPAGLTLSGRIAIVPADRDTRQTDEQDAPDAEAALSDY